MKKLFFLALFFLASCAPQVTPIPQVTVTHTATVQVTATSAPTATPTEPPTPTTYTPEQIKQMKNTEILAAAPEAEGLEKFISPAGKHIVLYRNTERQYTQAYNMLTNELVDVIHVSTDPEKPTKITMEDLTSGKLADSERLQCPAFADKVIPGDWFFAKGDTIWSVVRMRPDPRYSDPSLRPQKMCSFSELTADLGRGEQKYMVMGLGNKNKDGSVKFFHGLAWPDLFSKFLDGKDDEFLIVTDEIRHFSGRPEGEILDKTRPEVESWAKEWESTDIMPEEFEKGLFRVSHYTWS